MHDCCQPLVETGLAKHGFPPLRCGLLALPTVCRKAGSHVTFQKTSPCKPLLGGVDMSPPCRIAQPTSRHDPGGWQPPAPPRQDRPGPIPPARPPRPLGAAGAAGPHGVWAADDNGHRDDQLAVAHHPQPQAIDPQPDPRCLAALPGAHPPPWLASLLEHTVVSRPRPLPPTLGRGALSRHLPPQPAQEGLASTRQRPAPLGPAAAIRPRPPGSPAAPIRPAPVPGPAGRAGLALAFAPAARGPAGGDVAWHDTPVVARGSSWPWAPPVVWCRVGVEETMAQSLRPFKHFHAGVR